MSSVTSLPIHSIACVAKGSSKFTPKVKPRAVRREKPAAEPGAEENDEGVPTTDRVAAEVNEADRETISSAPQRSEPQQQQQPPQTLSSGATVIQPGGMTSPPPISEYGIPMVGSSMSQRPQPSTGTPIVVGVSGSSIPRSGLRHMQQGRQGSALGSPTSPTVGGPPRLASLNSTLSLTGSLSAAMQSPLSSSRRSGFDSQINSPRSKRHRSATGTPEPTVSLKLKTADDYRLLDTDVIGSLPIGFFCRDMRHGVPTQEYIESENDIVRRLMAPTKEGPGGSTQEKPAAVKAAPAQEAKTTKVDNPAASSNYKAVQVRVVDGKTVVDSASLVINRSEMAGTSNEPLELVDESARPRYVNSLTYVKRRGTRKRWTKEETDVFFSELRTYGSDFEMIASAMPGRNRYDIKNKFKKEEKLNPQRITNIMLLRPEPVAAVPPAVGPDGLPISLEGYSMVNTPDPQHNTAGDDDGDSGDGDEELPDARNVTFAPSTK
ncbi:hypothetical protein GGH95_000683 [Coemansia sp. RSA 1836]|nr:hypothetical protein GGH95_000683 [Coemansia sp. RSA 1836]